MVIFKAEHKDMIIVQNIRGVKMENDKRTVTVEEVIAQWWCCPNCRHPNLDENGETYSACQKCDYHVKLIKNNEKTK